MIQGIQYVPGQTLRAVKLRLGYPSLSEDLAALSAVRRSISGGDVAIMVDFNQALTSTEAILPGGELEKEGTYWLEHTCRPTVYESTHHNRGSPADPLQVRARLKVPQGE